MALTAYQTALQNLLQAPNSPIPLITSGTATTFINTARNQIAADAECIRIPATLALTGSTQNYNFSSISVGGASGVGSIMTVRSARIGVNQLDIRPWEWFAFYFLGSATTGTPTVVSQQGQGVNGTFYFYPTPNTTFTVNMDTVCLPIALASDSDPEAIPQLWTDAIPFYAAWLAMQNMQRQADAEMMLRRYEMLVRRGRELGTATQLPYNYPGGLGAATAASKTTLGPVASAQSQRQA